MDDNWGYPLMTQGGTWINVISLQMLEGLWMIRLWKNTESAWSESSNLKMSENSQVARYRFSVWSFDVFIYWILIDSSFSSFVTAANQGILFSNVFDKMTETNSWTQKHSAMLTPMTVETVSTAKRSPSSSSQK